MTQSQYTTKCRYLNADNLIRSWHLCDSFDFIIGHIHHFEQQHLSRLFSSLHYSIINTRWERVHQQLYCCITNISLNAPSKGNIGIQLETYTEHIFIWCYFPYKMNLVSWLKRITKCSNHSLWKYESKKEMIWCQ